MVPSVKTSNKKTPYKKRCFFATLAPPPFFFGINSSMGISWLFKRGRASKSGILYSVNRQLDNRLLSQSLGSSSENQTVSPQEEKSHHGGLEKALYTKKHLLPTIVEEDTSLGLVALTIVEPTQSDDMKGSENYSVLSLPLTS